MSEHVPLDRLVINLLALAEAAPHLSPAALARVAALANDIKPTSDSLATVSLRLQLELMSEPAFNQAKNGWDALMPLRVGLKLGELEKTLPNPTGKPATGVALLAGTAKKVMCEPQQEAEQITLLQRLAKAIGLQWPRPVDPYELQSLPKDD